MMKFYHREKELNYLKTYCQLEPNSVLFIYGPKSSGKSATIRRVIKELEDSNLVFFYYNFREHATPNKEEFISIFCKGKTSLNDVFIKIREGVIEAVKDGYKPVLIIDELQRLSGIYLDENKNKTLLNELFNLFVYLTKTAHLCHVICLTSNYTLINEVFLNSTLSNGSKYYPIDYWNKETVKSILKEEGFTNEEINFAADYLSLPYEIIMLKDKKKLGMSIEETIKQWINIEKGKIWYLIMTQNEFETEKLINILKLFNNNLKIHINDIEDELINEVKFLIKNEVLFYDILNSVVRPTSIIEWHAIRELLQVYNVE
jgi:AAA+ ATPase superfamily predicted ATPase